MGNRKYRAFFINPSIVIASLVLLLSACSGGSSSSSSGGGAVTGVSTPSKVSVVNTN